MNLLPLGIQLTLKIYIIIYSTRCLDKYVCLKVQYVLSPHSLLVQCFYLLMFCIKEWFPLHFTKEQFIINQRTVFFYLNITRYCWPELCDMRCSLLIGYKLLAGLYVSVIVIFYTYQPNLSCDPWPESIYMMYVTMVLLVTFSEYRYILLINNFINFY